MNKQELAVQLKHTGCNCCQAVLCAFAEESGLSELQLRQIGAGFGAGMGCMEATCGALIGALHLRHTSEERLERTAAYLASFDLERLVLMHCTGENAVEYLRSGLSCEVATLPAGRSMTL